MVDFPLLLGQCLACSSNVPEILRKSKKYWNLRVYCLLVSGARSPYIKVARGSHTLRINNLYVCYWEVGLNKASRLTWAERELNPRPFDYQSNAPPS